MTVFYLVRHGEPQWELGRKRNLPAWSIDLVPLTPNGKEQIANVARSLCNEKIDKIISSPMTRCLESATVFSFMLNLPISVEFELHEWIPNLNFNWLTLQDVLDADKERDFYKGEWPEGEIRTWEPMSSVRERMMNTLAKYSHLKTVIVLTHGIAIRSLTEKDLGFAGVEKIKINF